ncbi:MAG: class I SAM-dependent methyltransferase [Gammaproteobacteria bacterium]|nr:class I SAM-dependent methyltransferase [Gammaproteobacteria bacterium]
MNRKNHWDNVYAGKSTSALGWYELHLRTSLSWIKALNLAVDAPLIDVGGGASTLVDDLLDAGHRSITVLDISEQALSSARTRLGKKADLVTWLAEDITSVELPAHRYAVWHDRAVFHFLTELEQQRQYRANLVHALQPGGLLIIGTFALEAPPRCSGLPVHRYSQEQLSNTLGEEFKLVKHHKELHVTPGGVEQVYLYCQFSKD